MPFRSSLILPLVAAVLLAAGCVPPAHVGSVRATPGEPAAQWGGPADAGAPLRDSESKLAMRGTVVPADVAGRLGRLSLTDVVDLALGNSPVTRATWAQARAAAAAYASARGRFLPSLEVDATGGPSKSISQNPARVPAERTSVNTSLSLQYVLLDFGARGGAMAAAHEALYAADLTHNSTVQGVVLQSEGAYFTYQASRGLAEAARSAVETARANLAAAERRHDVGLATIADVLQARTALAQAQLALQTADGSVHAGHTQLALATGLAANSKFDVAPDTGTQPVLDLAENVDSLVERAVRDRPDVAAARALARQSDAQVRAARSAALPVVTLGANEGRSYSNNVALEGSTYALTFGFSWPIFSGLSHEYDVVTAKENYAAGLARAEQSRLQAIAQVVSAYHILKTAQQRVATARELLVSATQSEEVARGRYAEGVGSILDLLTAQSALADARAQAVQSRWTWYSALAQLSHDAGVLGPRGETNLHLGADPARRP